MNYWERFALELQLAYDTKNVHIGSTGDHLFWDYWDTDDNGENYHVNCFVFELNYRNILHVRKSSRDGDDRYLTFKNRENYLDWIRG